MRINTNVAALNSYNQLKNTQNNLSKSLSRLSSGKRINGAADDAAGLAISEKMNSQVRGLAQAQRNAQDGISMIQTAEGALKETHSILQRMRELSVQSANDTNTQADRDEIQKEVDELASELTRISNTTEFNTQSLLNGAVKDGNVGTANFHIGSNKGQSIELSINAMDAASLGVAGSSTEYSGTNSGVESSSFDDSVGDKIVNGANITFDYTAGTTDAAASLTAGAAAAPTTNLASISADAELTVNIDGADYTLDKAAMTAAAGVGQTIANLETALQTAIGTAGTVSNDGSNLTIDSATSGADSSVSISITGTTTTGIDTAFGFSNAASASGTSADDTVTVSDGTASQVVTVSDSTATEFSVNSGDFEGITVTEDSGISNLASGSHSVAVSAQTINSTSATFSNNELNTEAFAAAGIDVSSETAANDAISVLDDAIASVSAERSKLGAYQNRLDHTINNLSAAEENLTAAESRISDVDMAREMMNMSKQQILSQAGTAMMAQANQLPQGVLQLLG